MSPDSKQQLQNFFQYLEFEKRLSAHTLKSYRNDLQFLHDYSQSNAISDWQLINAIDIRKLIAQRHKQSINSSSLQRQLSAIRSFYDFLIKRQLAEDNPARHVKAPKQQRKLPKALDVIR